MENNALLPLIILFSLIGGAFSLIGGFFFLWKAELTKKIIIHLVTFATGTLLAVAFLDLLPEAFHEFQGEPQELLPWTLGGMVAFFILERILLRVHYHEETEPHAHAGTQLNRRSLPWLVTIGDGIHNFIDGIVITAGFLAGAPVGIVTALAVAAHEIPQEIADFSILYHAGVPKKRVAMLNIGAALMTTVGAIVAYFLRSYVEAALAPLLATAAGVFIYIAAADLIPEIHHADHKRDKPAHVLHVVILLLASILFISYVSQAAHGIIEPEAIH